MTPYDLEIHELHQLHLYLHLHLSHFGLSLFLLPASLTTCIAIRLAWLSLILALNFSAISAPNTLRTLYSLAFRSDRLCFVIGVSVYAQFHPASKFDFEFITKPAGLLSVTLIISQTRSLIAPIDSRFALTPPFYDSRYDSRFPPNIQPHR